MRYIKKTISGLSSAWQGIDHNQLIYMEKSFSPAVCGFIEEKLDFLESSLEPHGLEFVYLPKVAEPINGQEYLNYIVPTGKRTHGFATSDVYDMLFPGVEDMPDSPFIMRCTWKGRLAVLEMWTFEGFERDAVLEDLHCFVMDITNPVRNSDPHGFSRILFDQFNRVHNNVAPEDDEGFCESMIDDESEYTPCVAGIEPEEEVSDLLLQFDCEEQAMCRKREEVCSSIDLSADEIDEDDTIKVPLATLPITVQWETTVNSLGADFLFNEVMASDQYKEATNKIYEAIEQLHKLGIGTLVIKSIARKDGSLSRICIDDNYNITLPEYNNMTIDMAPMTKAVFLLFLRHEEGIVFKNLPDYRKELMVLYWDMVESDDEASVRSKVERVTNPFSNAINEHCSRIKAAFALKFDDTLASSYYINGRRGEAKRISLPRELVEWELL